MRIGRVLLLALVGLGASNALAQSALREYRPELIVTLPRWHGVGVTMLGEQHLAVRDLAPAEVILGVGLVSPALAHGSLALELRQVRPASGVIEHRWLPTANLRAELWHGFELRDRVRVELRDIDGHWSRRYQNRAALQHPLDLAGSTLTPYAYYDLSYDTRFAVLNRRESGVGVRVPAGRGTSVDSFLMRQTDTRRATDVLLAAGMIVRLAL